MKRIRNSIPALLLAALLVLLCGCGRAAEPAAQQDASEQATVPAAASETPGATQGTTESHAEPAAAEDPTEAAAKVIVVFFSRTGHTKPIAEYIAEELNADSYELEAAIPYTDEDIRYYTDCRADREQADPSARPEIAGELPDLSAYDTVYLGYPIWHGQAPKIIYTFLENVDLTGKTVIPFCTSASSPVGSSAENLHPLAPNAVWIDGTRFAIDTAREEIVSWLEAQG